VRRMPTDAQPLAGIRVLDLSNLIAGPLAGMFLADFGAEVIKVEHPSRPDELRRWGNAKNDVGLYFKVLNRNKKTIGLDLKSDEGRALALRLIEHCDVVVENFRPDTLERWGLGWETLHETNPELVMLRISGYGQTGEYRRRAGFGTVAEAFGGAAAITGHSDGPPLLPPFPLGDATTAIFGAFGVLVALHRRAREGGGQMVDLALYEGLLTMLGPQVIDFDQLGMVQKRDGSRLPFVSPRNAYETADGAWVALSGSTQRTFERLMQGFSLDHVPTDPRFADNRGRVANADALDAEIQAAVLKLPLERVLEIAEEVEAPIGPVNEIGAIFDDPHVRDRGNIATVQDEELGTVRMQGVVPRLTETPGAITHAGARHRQYNREVYPRLLGLDEETLAGLEARGVI
jgi:crotonobetainyl-CoA:carnitine CoA-transferase CaiB-like acyl-CoA transferase